MDFYKTITSAYFFLPYLIIASIGCYLIIKESKVFKDTEEAKWWEIVVVIPIILVVSILSPPFLILAAVFKLIEITKESILNLVHRKDRRRDKILRKYGASRIVNSGYFKLFCNLSGKYLPDSDKQLDELKRQFNSFDFIIIPIVFNANQMDSLRDSKFTEMCNELNAGLCFLYTKELYDYNEADFLKVHEDFGNSNYGTHVEDYEIAATALSTILNIEIDGKAKLAILEKNSTNTIRSIDYQSLLLSKTLNLKNDSVSIQLEKSSYSIITSFLSFRFRNSSMPEYYRLKEIALDLYNDYVEELRIKEELDVLNLLLLAFYIDPASGIMYRLVQDPDEIKEEKEIIKSQVLLKDTAEILDEFPDYDEKDLFWLKKAKIESEIDLILQKEIEYSSKVFLRTAVLVRKALPSGLLTDDLNSEFDYSGVGISYAKFIEGELNSSLVQQIRELLGIQMPYYFNRYCDVPGQYFIQGEKNFKVDFNRGNRSNKKYYPPGLGQTIVSSQLKKNELRLKLHSIDKLVELGTNFNRYRNLTAHPELIDSNTLLKMEEIIALLHISGVLDDLLDLRRQLQGFQN